MPQHYHEGELAVQARAGTVEQAAAMARTFRTSLPAPLMRFLATQRWIIVGATDTAGRVWASPVVGAPGFVRAADETTVRIDALPVTSDPLRNLAGRPTGQPAGLLAIDLGRRNRARINGTLRHDAGGVVMSVERAYPNCMKYIQRRENLGIGDQPPVPVVVAETDRVTAEQIDLLRAADTAFIATIAEGHGADVSHRGGPPGFLRCLGGGRVIQFVDYPGNGMFNTLGNLELDSRAGLTITCFGTGDLLQLTGRATVVRTPLTSAAPGTVDFVIDRAVHTRRGVPFRFGPVEYSPFLPRQH